MSTTSDQVRVTARQTLGDAVAFTRGAWQVAVRVPVGCALACMRAYLHTQALTWAGPVGQRLEEDGAGERQALMDMLLLARCSAIVSSVHSTFSYVAHALAGVRPVVVSASKTNSPASASSTRGRSVAAGTASKTNSSCIASPSSAACFHAGDRSVRANEDILACLSDKNRLALFNLSSLQPCWF